MEKFIEQFTFVVPFLSWKETLEVCKISRKIYEHTKFIWIRLCHEQNFIPLEYKTVNLLELFRCPLPTHVWIKFFVVNYHLQIEFELRKKVIDEDECKRYALWSCPPRRKLCFHKGSVVEQYSEKTRDSFLVGEYFVSVHDLEHIDNFYVDHEEVDDEYDFSQLTTKVNFLVRMEMEFTSCFHAFRPSKYNPDQNTNHHLTVDLPKKAVKANLFWDKKVFTQKITINSTSQEYICYFSGTFSSWTSAHEEFKRLKKTNKWTKIVNYNQRNLYNKYTDSKELYICDSHDITPFYFLC